MELVLLAFIDIFYIFCTVKENIDFFQLNHNIAEEIQLFIGK